MQRATLRHLLLFISLNDVSVGKTHVPSNKLECSIQIANLLRQFPQGIVSIVGPGSEKNWGYKAGSFDLLAKCYMDALATCDHPIYNPEHLYSHMIMNKTTSWIKAERYTKEAPDIHFTPDDSNYERLIRLATAVTQMTMFLGQLADVSHATGTILASTTKLDKHKMIEKHSVDLAGNRAFSFLPAGRGFSFSVWRDSTFIHF